MKITFVFIITMIGLSACQTISQIVPTSVPDINFPDTPTVAPTIFVPPTSTPLSQSTPFLLPSDLISPENIQGLQELAILGKGKINNFRYSQDGKLLALATMRGIYIYDAQTFMEKKYIPTEDSVNFVAFSPDGKTIASTFRKGSVQLWQVSSGGY